MQPTIFHARLSLDECPNYLSVCNAWALGEGDQAFSALLRLWFTQAHGTHLCCQPGAGGTHTLGGHHDELKPESVRPGAARLPGLLSRPQSIQATKHPGY